MYNNVIKTKTKINSKLYSLSDIARFYEQFVGSALVIDTNMFTLKVTFDKSSLPHLIGLHYAYSHKKDSRQYRGESGFELLKSGKITVDDFKKNIKNNPNVDIPWKRIQRRIEYLPMFFNTVEKKGRLKIIEMDNVARYTLLDGNFIVFLSTYEKAKQVMPALVLKIVGKGSLAIKTFIVEDSITLLGALEEVDTCTFKLINALENEYPKNYISYK